MTASAPTNNEAQVIDGGLSSDETAGAAQTQSLSQVVSFQLGNEIYALDIMIVREIILMGEVTEVPEVPDYITGLINLRGSVIPIVDLRKRFGLQVTAPNEQRRIIVVNAANTTFGIVVDAVSQVLRIDDEQIERPPSGMSGLDQAYMKGLIKLDDKIMILLNIDRILLQDEQARLAKSE